MEINSDYRDLLRCLNAEGVRYLIVGGYAVMIHSEPRFTKDLDLWIEPELQNAERLCAALRAFGAPLSGVSPADFTTPEVFYQIGVDPVRADFMTSVPGLVFAASWINRVEVDFGGEAAGVLNLEDVITSKRATGRKQDVRDLRRLRRK